MPPLGWLKRYKENESYCRTCKTWRPKGEFNYRDVERVLLQYDCRDCQQGLRRQSYANHRETAKATNNERTRLAIESGREYVYNYLLEHPCIECGNSNVLVLTFDHVRGTKKRAVAEMVSSGYSIETIEAEIGKCDVVCFNCHMRRERIKRGGR